MLGKSATASVQGLSGGRGLLMTGDGTGVQAYSVATLKAGTETRRFAAQYSFASVSNGASRKRQEKSAMMIESGITMSAIWTGV
jgi:hypothetical protein